MSTDKPSKINLLLQTEPQGVVFTSSWLVSLGYSLDLQKRYKSSKWMQSIGNGAMTRVGDQVDYLGALYSIQRQLGLTVHPGGRTALSLLGKAHYLELAPTKVILFGQAKETLPTWFKKWDWGLKLDYHPSSFLPVDLGITELEVKTFSIKLSSAARAMMECLYLAPHHQDLMECFELMEGLNNLRPQLVQQLLEQCTSVKVKRLFLYLAEKANHDWVRYLNLDKIDLGRGKRSIIQGGIYVPKYQITVPKELKNNGNESL